LNEPDIFARLRPSLARFKVLDVDETPLFAGFDPAVSFLIHPIHDGSGLCGGGLKALEVAG
jgi:hypothetical protein